MKRGLVLVTLVLTVLAACGSGSSTGTAPGGSTAACRTGGSASGPWGWSGNRSQGFLPAAEPDANCDGAVVIGILSPGDTHDHGYYESFVDAADGYAQQNGWKVITVDLVNPADAATQARNLCRQHVDMVAVAASQLKDAIPVAQEEVCRNTVWYVAGGEGVIQNDYFVQSHDDANESGYASGYAAGLLMRRSGSTKAGFITGPRTGFTTAFATAFLGGIRALVSSATLVVNYTGDFNDSALAVEAMRAQQSQGVGVVYPYLGGATDAVTAVADAAGIPALSPGTDRCSSTAPSYAISVIFSPGDYFAAALAPFRAGTLRVGTSRTWRMGRDPVPTVRICHPVGSEAAQLSTLIARIGDGTVKPDAIVKSISLG